MKYMTTRKIVALGALVIVLGVAATLLGSRGGGDATGVIEIAGVVPLGTTVFVDNRRVARFSEMSSVELDNLAVGTHAVVVAKDGYWPWSKELVLANNERIALRPFLIPQEPSIRVAEEEHEGRADAVSKLRSYTLPQEDAPLISHDGAVHVWVTQNEIQARFVSEAEAPPPFCITGTCEYTLTVLPTEADIRNIAFFPSRNDVIMFSTENGIFALELDKRGTQNFQPIYLGISPSFIMQADNLLAIEDSDTIFFLQL